MYIQLDVKFINKNHFNRTEWYDYFNLVSPFADTFENSYCNMKQVLNQNVYSSENYEK